MTEDKKNPDTPEANQRTRPYAKRRDWTDEEVAEAVEYLKREIPEEWAELERLELTTRDLNGSRAIGIQLATLSELHPECEPYELSQLAGKVRDVRCNALGIK